METPLENILVSTFKEEMISFMHSHPEYFEEAIELAVSDKKQYSVRAAWVLWSCIEENDERIKPHINKIIDSITTKNDSHQRELFKILLPMELNEEHEGFLFNVCVGVWEKINKNPSVRFTAFKFMIKIAKKYPELNNEVILLIQDQYIESLSSSAKKSINKMMKELNQ